MKLKHTQNIDFMYGTPAAIDHDDGILYINDELFYKLNKFQQEFIINHELGHYYLATHDEMKADEYAFNQMAGKYNQSLKQSIGTLEAILDPECEYHQKRIENLYMLCLKWDAAHGNKLAAQELAALQNISRGDGKDKAENNAAGSQTADMANYNAQLIQSVATMNASQEQAKSSSQSTTLIIIAIVVIAGLMIYKN